MSQVTCCSLGVVLAAATAMAGPTVEQCVAASSQAQRDQRAGALLSARRQLEVCSDAQCPAVVQGDCTRWLAEVLAATPSLVVVVRVDGVDQRQARVLVDGHLWLAALSGTPEALDPGERELTVTVGAQTRVQRLLVNVAEKNRLVVFEFSSAPVEPPESDASPAPRARRFPVLPVALTSVAVAGVATFAALGLTGRASLAALLEQPCVATQSCNPGPFDEVRRRFLVADVSLGLGLVGAALAVWQWWAWGSAPVMVAPGPGSVTLLGRF
jgi:hypothetical protein